MKWLITGGCGFLGTNLIRQLIAEGGHSVRVLDNLSVGSEEDLREVCEASGWQVQQASTGFPGDSICDLMVGDIRNPDDALRASDGADVVVHLAANTGVGPSVDDPVLDCEQNVIGTLNMLEACRKQGVGRFIFASSGAPVGEVTPPIHEEMPAHPVSPYGASKLAGEAYCSAYSRTFDVATVCLRFSNVYGPGSRKKSSVVAKFISRAMDGKELEIYGDGGQTRDFIYIDDLINALKLSATVPNIGGEVFQIATNSETTLNELVERLRTVLASFDVKPGEIKYGEQRAGDVRRNFSDISKAREKLGWEPNVDLDAGLELTMRYFVSGDV